MLLVLKQQEIKISRSYLWGNVFAFLIPTLMFLEVHLIGRLFISEILLLCMLPFLLLIRGRLLLAPLPRPILLLGLAWLLAQVLTDVIRDTPYEDLVRGWSKITFLLLNFSAIYLLFNGKKNRFLLFALGIALGQILAYFLNPNVYVEDYPWKFGYGMAVTQLAVLAAQMKFFSEKKSSLTIIISGAGLLNLYMGFRSLGLICFLTMGFVMAKQSNVRGLKRINWRKIIVLGTVGAVMAYGTSVIYEYGVNNGWVDQDELDKYQQESSGDLGVLLGGRSEILSSAQAVIDSPIIGHGSWAKDAKYAEIMLYVLRERGYKISGGVESDLIPSHSYIMGAWVESGLVGALFWLWALILTVRALIANYVTNRPLALLVAFVAFNLLWNILFSPFGAETRLYAAYDLALMIFAVTLPKPPLGNERAA